MKNQYHSKKKNLSKILINCMKIDKKKISHEKSIYDKQGKSFENTHKIHENSKTYLDARNEFAPKLKLSWVLSDPTQIWPTRCSGQAVTGETPFRTKGPLVLKFF